MVSVINELWIFDSGGVPILDYSKGTDLHYGLFEGFISAIKSFWKETTQKELKSFSIDERKFTCKSVFDDIIIIVVSTSNKTKTERITRALDDITTILADLYSIEELKKWHGNMKYFKELRDRVDEYFSKS